LVTVTLRISSFTARSWGDGVARHGSRISRMPLAPWVSSRSFSMLEAGAEVAQALDAMIGAGVEAVNVLASPVLYTARDLMFPKFKERISGNTRAPIRCCTSVAKAVFRSPSSPRFERRPIAFPARALLLAHLAIVYWNLENSGSSERRSAPHLPRLAR
jgi:hypothetical protein